MTQEFKFVDDVWTEQGGQRLTVAFDTLGITGSIWVEYFIKEKA